MTEPELLLEVVKICDGVEPRVRWLHLAMVRKERCPWLAGLPDLFLVGTTATCWREVKTGSTALTAVQDDWLDRLEAAGADADLWTERDLYDGSIRAEIAALNGITVEREPWIPDGATPAEIAHRQALYG